MKNDLIRRSYLCEVRAEGDGGNVIVGRPIVYDRATDICGYFEEIIERGALDGADLTDVRFLVNHDTSRIPLARSRRNNGNSTMQLLIDDEGLNIRAQLDTENNSEARALYSAVQRGDISGMSFMFSIDTDEWEKQDTDYPTRRIKKIASVVEVSAVTFPAYEQTEISTRSAKELESARTLLESMKNARSNKPLEKGDKSELELLKMKINLLGGF